MTHNYAFASKVHFGEGTMEGGTENKSPKYNKANTAIWQQQTEEMLKLIHVFIF